VEKFAINSSPLPVRELAKLRRERRLFLPDLQRGFVWDQERVRMLFDSLYRGYPVGSLLLWRPVGDASGPPISTRSWDLFPPGGPTGVGTAEPEIDAPEGAVYVLDGQQRLTSLFKVLFDCRVAGHSTPDPDLYVSLSSDPRWADQPFLYKSRQVGTAQEREGLIVPAAVLFAGVRSLLENGAESKAVAQAISRWVNPTADGFYPAIDRASQIRNAVLNAEIAAYELDTSADDDNVIEIFGRLNQQAVRLTPADLAAARLTGKMKGFRRRADEALRTVVPEAFAVPEGSERVLYGGRADTDLLVRTAMCLATGNVKYRDAEKLKGGGDGVYSQIEPKWDAAVSAVAHTARMFQAAGVPDGDWLPYRYMLLVPSVAVGSGHVRPADQWLGWALAGSLWGLYGGSSETKAQADARLAKEGRWEELWESLRAHAKRPETLIPEPEDFHHGIVQARGVQLAQLVGLVRTDATSFFGTRMAAPGPEGIEIHHVFPRVLFSGQGRVPRESRALPDRIGNLTPLAAGDNRALGAREPADYFPELTSDLRATYSIPDDPALWHLDRYGDFCAAREASLCARVAALLALLGVP
jgi:hypothetical protein